MQSSPPVNPCGASHAGADRTSARRRHPSGDDPYYAMPELNFHKGLVNACYIHGYILSCRCFAEVPRRKAKAAPAETFTPERL